MNSRYVNREGQKMSLLLLSFKKYYIMENPKFKSFDPNVKSWTELENEISNALLHEFKYVTFAPEIESQLLLTNFTLHSHIENIDRLYYISKYPCYDNAENISILVRIQIYDDSKMKNKNPIYLQMFATYGKYLSTKLRATGYLYMSQNPNIFFRVIFSYKKIMLSNIIFKLKKIISKSLKDDGIEAKIEEEEEEEEEEGVVVLGPKKRKILKPVCIENNSLNLHTLCYKVIYDNSILRSKYIDMLPDMLKKNLDLYIQKQNIKKAILDYKKKMDLFCFL